ncbi:BTB/POZ domain-containing protein 10-like [Paramacrobiotus metropolitanus]|uniref:BTB/POZ domain-containing protein 10-like n=1 Tax=Paramacrobiotus metropolitanus TaxID=2943436 RepID=UPI0024456FED|nr:BTB/POZ domain-containing protein 10-like [Paramacrobiotus metropolitanus]XP_055339719.1 BTB/POZ domain-containing protein 10-like [Paramacrobiotus metropolitanus]XP_055339720.1 BTB/POZ domain-containing protein 10-like [Paramacrobiotus metropolitanus]XP_055339721.1 BTB/POZ domain-containing protein 10-like [Paramacrobiotus metropolitanus]XP_055339722.1 BTB/POZ domain-containing protein 10-like [Paramacrobiotus metropolitanus]
MDRTSPNVRSSSRNSVNAGASNVNEQLRSSPRCDVKHRAGNANTVTFVVNGTHFTINRDCVAAHPETMLGKMVACSPTHDIVKQNDRGDFVLNMDFSADFFRVALDYYKLGYIKHPADISLADLRDLCDFLLIPFNANTIKTYDLRALLHEISNDGARREFESQLEQKIMPCIVQRALKGERECNVVILMDDEEVHWNDKLPPPSGEEQSQILHSTALLTFFKYVENRDVAKRVLTERGFKKVCLGTEGFPTHVDRIRPRWDGKLEASYFYVQRPFIRLSWEKEDARSRHVDFQCIRSRSRSAGSLAAAAAEHPLDDVNAIVNIPVEPEPDVEFPVEQPVVVEPEEAGVSSGEEEEHE